MASPQQLKTLKTLAKFSPLLLGLGFVSKCYWKVGVGELGLKFNRFSGLSPQTYIEGFHLRIPYLEVPINFKTKVHNYNIQVSTPNRDLQLVNISAVVVYKPDKKKLHTIYTTLGPKYDTKVLNNIVSEIIRGVIAQFNAQQLNVSRDQVSNQIKEALRQRASPYGVVVDEFAISSISFTKEYQAAVERKQIAEQKALEAKYVVDQAIQKKKNIIIQAQGDAKSIELIGEAVKNNPAYLDLQKIDFSKEISQIIAKSRNRILLDSDMLLVNSLAEDIKREFMKSK